MAGKPRLLSEEDREFLAEVPSTLKDAYRYRDLKTFGEEGKWWRVNIRSVIAKEFNVSEETVKDWLYNGTFPISRKEQFCRLVIRRLERNRKIMAEVREALRRVIEETEREINEKAESCKRN
jgi:hypothetical protein